MKRVSIVIAFLILIIPLTILAFEKEKLRIVDIDNKEIFVGETIIAAKAMQGGIIRVYKKKERDIKELIKIFKEAGVTAGPELSTDFWMSVSCNMATPISCEGECFGSFVCDLQGGGGIPLYCICK